MKKVLVTGALGQIGSELTLKMREVYGADNIIATDIRKTDSDVAQSGPFEVLDVTDEKAMFNMAKNMKWIRLYIWPLCCRQQQKRSRF